MTKKLIYFSDLSHTDQVVASEIRYGIRHELAWLLNRVPARNMYRHIFAADVVGGTPPDTTTTIPEAWDTAMGV